MFSDIDNHWASKSICQLEERHLVSGYPDGSFRPEGSVTRAEFAVFMCNIFPQAREIREPILFRDVPDSHWADGAIKKASSLGFLVGYPDRTFKPEQAITRVQAIGAFTRQLGISVPPTLDKNYIIILQKWFDDAADIPNYAKEKMTAATFGYLIVNYPKIEKLKPNRPATRGEIAALICQVLRIWNTVPLQYIAGSQLLAIAPKYDDASDFAEGRARVRIGQKYGFIDASGTLVIPQDYHDSAEQFSQGLCWVSVDNKYGYIDKNGRTVIPLEFQSAASFSEGLGLVQVEGNYCFIDLTGNIELQLDFYGVASFHNGLARVQDGQKYGYIDKTGQLAIPLEYDGAADFAEGMARIKIGEKYGFIDTTGKQAIAPEFDGAESFSEGLALVRKGYNYGFIDRTGTLVLELEDTARSFSQGLAAITIDGKWGYIDKSGQVAIAPQFYGFYPVWDYNNYYESIHPFSQELAMVRMGGHSGFIDRLGNVVIHTQFSDARSFCDGLARVHIDGQWIMEGRGNTGSGSPAEYGYVLRGGKWGYIRHPQLENLTSS